MNRLSPDLIERFGKREIIAHNDSTSGSTKEGWKKWEAYRQEQLQKLKQRQANAIYTSLDFRDICSDLEIRTYDGRLVASWTQGNSAHTISEPISSQTDVYAAMIGLIHLVYETIKRKQEDEEHAR
jgi:hypothetical protein